MVEDGGLYSISTFGRSGWILVIGIIVAFLFIPAIITLYPPTWVSFRFAFLILPLIPAVGIAVLAVWATTQA